MHYIKIYVIHHININSDDVLPGNFRNWTQHQIYYTWYFKSNSGIEFVCNASINLFLILLNTCNWNLLFYFFYEKLIFSESALVFISHFQRKNTEIPWLFHLILSWLIFNNFLLFHLFHVQEKYLYLFL